MNRFHYDAPPAGDSRRENGKLLNMDQYNSDEEFNGNASPKKKKYSLRQKRANTTRYQVNFIELSCAEEIKQYIYYMIYTSCPRYIFSHTGISWVFHVKIFNTK